MLNYKFPLFSKLKRVAWILLWIAMLLGSALAITWYWSANLQKQIHVEGISAGCLISTPEGYRDKVTAFNLDDTNDRVFITLYEENFAEIWFRWNYTCVPSGVIVSCTMQYGCVWHNTNTDIYTYKPLAVLGGLTENTLQQLNIDWVFYGIVDDVDDMGITDADANLVELYFQFDDEGLSAGDYDVEITVELGGIPA